MAGTGIPAQASGPQGPAQRPPSPRGVPGRQLLRKCQCKPRGSGPVSGMLPVLWRMTGRCHVHVPRLVGTWRVVPAETQASGLHRAWPPAKAGRPWRCQTVSPGAQELSRLQDGGWSPGLACGGQCTVGASVDRRHQGTDRARAWEPHGPLPLGPHVNEPQVSLCGCSSNRPSHMGQETNHCPGSRGPQEVPPGYTRIRKFLMRRQQRSCGLAFRLLECVIQLSSWPLLPFKAGDARWGAHSPYRG